MTRPNTASWTAGSFRMRNANELVLQLCTELVDVVGSQIMKAAP